MAGIGFVKVPLAVALSAYSAGNNVGGLPDLGQMIPTTDGAKLLSVQVSDHANQKAALDLLFFGAKPAATFADKAAFPTLSGADCALVLARVPVATADYVTIGGAAFATEKNLIIALPHGGPGQDIYLAINTSGTPTYGAADDLTILLGYETH